MAMETVLPPSPPEFLKLLAHDVRWQLLSLLAESDLRVQELVAQVGRPMNLVSYHLGLLRQGHLVNEHRSSEDGRDIYYSLELERLANLYAASGAALHPVVGTRSPAPRPAAAPAPAPVRVLFLCTHNSARSQMAEALLRRHGGAGVEVFSAGTTPGAVHPFALATLADMGIDASGQRSKHLDTFAGESFDYIITVCDRVREVCPVFPGDPHRVHWSFADPAAVAGSETEQRRAFEATARQLGVRLRHFLFVVAQRMTTLAPQHNH